MPCAADTCGTMLRVLTASVLFVVVAAACATTEEPTREDILNNNPWIYDMVTEAEQSAHAEGQATGYDAGYSDGQNTGYLTGRDAGYDDGYASGYGDGYDDAYSEAASEYTPYYDAPVIESFVPRGRPDMDCSDIGYSDFPVFGDDPHGFDRDGDGIGCESD